MIRRFFGMVIFTTTILIASFGQNIFGRDDLITWMKTARVEAPRHASKAMERTDVFLSHLTPSAGSEASSVCTFDSLNDAQTIYKA
jgi:hypothetical protein